MQHQTMLPKHDKLGPLTRAVEVACLLAAAGLIVMHLMRFAAMTELWSWWLPIAILSGVLLADFVSGVVHWFADTWGSETMPVLGRRFLRPFRVHHVNPDDFLVRDFIDCNGDVAGLTCVFLLGAFLIPAGSALGKMAAVFVVAFAACGLPTNQVHQWAHMTEPPWLVRLLQRCSLLLSYQEHMRHHHAPYTMNYCIALGWCNRVLTASAFFPTMEKFISRLTGLQPRSDDHAFAVQVEGAAGQTTVAEEERS